MKVFKYRPGEDLFERDLSTIEKNQFWSSSKDQLNDPCETLTDKTRINKLQHWIAKQLKVASVENLEFLNKNTEEVFDLDGKMGIFALSKTHLDELLWAHYANSHKGFCIEYDLSKLEETEGKNGIYSLPVKYKKRPPKLKYRDVLRTSYNGLIKKSAFYKPKRWEYEQEHRIIPSKIGFNTHHFDAIESIYFGLKMSENEKEEMMNRLRGRGIKFYQIELIPNSYEFKATRLFGNSKEIKIYLRKIPSSISKEKISFEIIKQRIHNYQGISEIKIELDQPIDKSILIEFSKYLKDQLMPEGIAVFISYYLKNHSRNNLEWANSSFTQNNWNFQINYEN